MNTGIPAVNDEIMTSESKVIKTEVVTIFHEKPFPNTSKVCKIWGTYRKSKNFQNRVFEHGMGPPWGCENGFFSARGHKLFLALGPEHKHLSKKVKILST